MNDSMAEEGGIDVATTAPVAYQSPLASTGIHRDRLYLDVQRLIWGPWCGACRMRILHSHSVLLPKPWEE